MTLSFKQYLLESSNDKGILKAVFVVGIPGAGKSYTVSKLKGSVSPVVVNTDRSTEFLSKKLKMPSNDETWKIFRDDSRRMTINMLYNYLNSLLPLFVDGTSNDLSNILSRAGILESIGYDVGMVFINTSLATAQARAKKRGEEIGREVNPEFIEKVFNLSQDNKDYFKGKFEYFKEVSNDPGEFDDATILKTFKSVASFYNEPLKNPVGKRTLEKLLKTKNQYLIPEIFEANELKKKCTSWYRS